MSRPVWTLEQLPEMTETALSGLQADQSLKQKILLAGTGESSSGTVLSFFRRRWIPLLAAVTAMLVLLIAGIGSTRMSAPQRNSDRVFAAATHTSASPVFLERILGN